MICAICGNGRKVERAHLTAKGIGGRGPKAPESAHDTAPLCAGTGGNTDPTSCHGAQHAGLLKVWRGDDGLLRYRASEKYAARLRRRNIPCHEGNEYVARFEGTDPDTIDAPDGDEVSAALGEKLHAYESGIADAEGRSALAWRMKAAWLNASRKAHVDELGEREGVRRFNEWRLELNDAKGRPAPISAAVASKMLTVVRVLGDWGADLPADKQYHLARAVESGVLPLDKLLVIYESLPLADALAESGLAPESKPKPPLRCPECGHEAQPAAFRVKEES